MQRLTQTQYYQNTKLQPSRKNVENEAAFNAHASIRENLYQRLLFLPMPLLKGKDVLEIGCSTGESALVWALLGARLTLIDADPTVESRIRGLFDRFGVSAQIRRFELVPFERFSDEPIFSLATAEGFLFTLPERDTLLRKMGSLLEPGGFGVVSFPDRFGSFFEFVKKAVLWRCLQAAKIVDPQSPAAFKIAQELLEPAYLCLPNPREFRTWWLDCMVSPFLTWDDCWDYSDMLSTLGEVNCAYYSSTPRIFEPSHLAWYKKVPSDRERRVAIMRSLSARKLDFLFGEAVGCSPDCLYLDPIEQAVERILRDLSTYFRSLDEPLPALDFEPIASLLRDAGIQHPLISELVILFRLFNKQRTDEIVAGYRALEHVPTTWGCSYHYLCFVRADSE